MKYIGEYWSRSKNYRILLILAVIYGILRLATQIFLFAAVVNPGAVAGSDVASQDLQKSYIVAAQHFQAREDLYLTGSLKDINIATHYLYSPAFAFFF